MAPILREQSSHKAYDIHAYGRKVLDALASGPRAAEAVDRATSASPLASSGGDGDGRGGDGADVPFAALLLRDELEGQNGGDTDKAAAAAATATVSTKGSKVAPSVSRFEVCRLFLATLNLANHGNVKIVPPPGQGGGGEEMREEGVAAAVLSLATAEAGLRADAPSLRVRLVTSSKRVEDGVAAFRAPSLREARRKRRREGEEKEGEEEEEEEEEGGGKEEQKEGGQERETQRRAGKAKGNAQKRRKTGEVQTRGALRTVNA